MTVLSAGDVSHSAVTAHKIHFIFSKMTPLIVTRVREDR